MKYIIDIEKIKKESNIGNKALSLHTLRKKWFLIPKTYVCTWDAHLDFLKDTKSLDIVRHELTQVIKQDQVYAVRSSANVEDDSNFSYAGQFLTELNVTGIEQILIAIKKIWESVDSSHVNSYRKKSSKADKAIKMAIIIQEMVPPIISGVAFSKNPLTGFNEIIVEAIQGDERLFLQSSATPLRWVYKSGQWLEKPPHENISCDLIFTVIKMTKKISKKFKRDIDLEWVFDGKNIYCVQAREITTTKNLNIYSNKLSKELLPGLIKPLVWSINIPITNGEWVNLITQLIGKNDINPLYLAKPFHYRTYFNMGIFGKIFEKLGFPPDFLEILMGIETNKKPSFKPSLKTYLLIPRMLSFLYDKWKIAPRIESFLVNSLDEYRQLKYQIYKQENASDLYKLLNKIQIHHKKITYYNIVAQLVMQVYHALLKKILNKYQINIEDIDLLGNTEELHEYLPTKYIETLSSQFKELSVSEQAHILNNPYQEIQKTDNISFFTKNFDRFLIQFGHLSVSGNDFSHKTWRETPEMLLNIFASTNERDLRPKQKLSSTDIRIKGFWALLFRLIFRRTRQWVLLREKIGYHYSFGIHLIREFSLKCGEFFKNSGYIDGCEDIFYLNIDEIQMIIQNKITKNEIRGIIDHHKQAMQKASSIDMPTVIFGEIPPPVVPKSERFLIGTPTSRGYYTGKVKVIRGLADFSKLEENNVLVIPYSDVSWLPLFAKAGAVIAESGGILSHSSIIAREYNIPAVVSVEGALGLDDDTMVSIDGYKGEIMIHSDIPTEIK